MKRVIHMKFGPLETVELKGWTIRLNSADRDGTLDGSLVGEQLYGWTFHPKSDALTVTSSAPGFTCGLPAEELRGPLWALIRRHGHAEHSQSQRSAE